jgi:hypothetical protein
MVAIGAGVVAQPALTVFFPAIQQKALGGVTAGSYIPCVVAFLLCFVVGHWFGMRMRTARALAAEPVSAKRRRRARLFR